MTDPFVSYLEIHSAIVRDAQERCETETALMRLVRENVEKKEKIGEHFPIQETAALGREASSPLRIGGTEAAGSETVVLSADCTLGFLFPGFSEVW